MDSGTDNVVVTKRVKRRHSAICKKVDELLLNSDLSLCHEHEEDLLKKYQTNDLTAPLFKLKHLGIIFELIAATFNLVILGLEIFAILEDKTWNHMCEMFDILHLRNLKGTKKDEIFSRPVIPFLASNNFSVPFDYFNVSGKAKLQIGDFHRGSHFEIVFLVIVIIIILATLCRFYHLTMLEPSKLAEKRIGITLLSVFAIALYFFAPLQIMSFSTQQFLYHKLTENEMSIYAYCFADFLSISNPERGKLEAIQDATIKKLRICERSGLKAAAFVLTVLNIHLILLGIFFHLVRGRNEQIHHVVSYTEEETGIRSEMLVYTKTGENVNVTQKIRSLTTMRKSISKMDPMRKSKAEQQGPRASKVSATGGNPLLPIDKEFFTRRKPFWKRSLGSFATRPRHNKVEDEEKP